MAKVTVYIDDRVWSKFRASVLQRHGSLKALSKEVEKSLKSTLAEDVLLYLASVKASLRPRTRARPVQRGASAEFQIRRMRRRRFESIS
jgi:hypothetical protein